MKIGFIGAGRAGTSLGKYLSGFDTELFEIVGYNSLNEEDARWSSKFTGTSYFANADELVHESDVIIISTPDGAVKDVWNQLSKRQMNGKIIAHLSGSLSSDVFSGREEYGIHAISLHPLFAFSDKESAHMQLNNVTFTLEGDKEALDFWQKVFDFTGNRTVMISANDKALYHAAASVLSNHVLAVLDTGYEMLENCGFDKEDARAATEALVLMNVQNAINRGTVPSLTGPIERGDIKTVESHLSVMKDEWRDIYLACGKRLIEMAKEKNPEKDYVNLETIIAGQR